MEVAVVGAGIFGAFTALHLQRLGARVSLFDSYGPGNARASSGGETRVIRRAYADRFYVDLANRALAAWAEFDRTSEEPLMRRTGALFLIQDARAEFGASVRAHFTAARIEHEVLAPDEVARRCPWIEAHGVRYAIFEPDAGVLFARRACRTVTRAFERAGGNYAQTAAVPERDASGRIVGLELGDGRQVRADRYVFACGPWLPKLFPEVFGERGAGALAITRQEVYFFGVQPERASYFEQSAPVWADLGERFWYGIPGGEQRGFKIADDTRGPSHDPDDAVRTPTPAGIAAAEHYLARRFPTLAGAPLLEARVCQYSNTVSDDYLLDRHPEHDQVWLLGGGSGHGFKCGPVVGELAALAVLDRQPRDARLRLRRSP